MPETGAFVRFVTSMYKEFLPYDKVRNNALKMAYRIHQDGFIPDVIYVSLRGGAYLANVISEYFKIVRRGRAPGALCRGRRPILFRHQAA